MSTFLVTGGTGMLGQELVPLLLAQGHKLFLLSRTYKDSADPNLVYVKGDVTKPHLGYIQTSEKIDAVVHCAALTSFRERNENELSFVNTYGTYNIVSWCLSHRVERLFHVSTLYVAGTHVGEFTEDDLSVGQDFNNRYEQSKYETEVMLRDHPLLDVTVLRLGILVGRYSDGYAALFEGFYRPVKAIVAAHRFAEQKLGFPKRELLERKLHLPKLKLPIRLYGDPKATLGITPVDWAAQEMVRLITSDAHERKVYHVAPDKFPMIEELTAGICDALSIRGYHADLSHTKNPLDMFYNRLVKDFHGYLLGNLSFQTSVGSTCPAVDRSYVEKIVSYWREHGNVDEGGRVPEQEPQEG